MERDDVLRDEIEAVANALIVPSAKNAGSAPNQKSGVFDAEGRFVAPSVTWRPDWPFNSEPERPEDSTVTPLPGTWMFGGPLFGHFGHFLMDSLARIWAYERLRESVEGILFIPKHVDGNIPAMLRTQLPLLRAMGIDCEVRAVTEPTRVDMLHVPWQGIGLSNGWELGSPAFRNYVRRFGGKSIEPRGHERIYLSRSELPKARASYLSEKILEAHLREAGYAILHPQKMSKEEQVAQYRRARWVISPDGSPLHLLAFVGNPEQDVAIIARRSADTHSIFEGQLELFTGGRAVTINALRDDWVPKGQRRASRLSWGELDLPSIRTDLVANGFLPPDCAEWPGVQGAEVEREIAEIGEREGRTYERLGQVVAA